jgi:hypothetical protein
MRQQRGTFLVLLAAGAVALLGATGLSVDTGHIFAFKSQLQNAADAAALAGAHGLLADPLNFAPEGQATRLAISQAALNLAGGDPITLTTQDISFPRGNTIRIALNRPVDLFFMRVVGIGRVNVSVRSSATITPATSGTGMRPFAILDQFGHGSECVSPNDALINSPPHGEFKNYAHTWRGKRVETDHYKSPYDAEFDGWDLSAVGDCSSVTGLIAPRDVDGQQVELKLSHWEVSPGNFGPVALGNRGADVYQENIVHGYYGSIGVSDLVYSETGNMIGPTKSGVDLLVAQDPNAKMVRSSTGRWVVVSDRYPMNESPRIVPIPMYSVYNKPGNGRTDFIIASIGSFFIERSAGQYVYGRFVQSRVKNGSPGDAPRNGGSGTVSGGGRLLGTVQLIGAE